MHRSVTYQLRLQVKYFTIICNTRVYSLKDELLGEDRVLAISRVSPGYMHAVQVDVTVWVCEMFNGKFVRLFNIQH